ncbi:hypothetical protein ACQ4LE_002150 [Meloidogyne hapla]
MWSTSAFFSAKIKTLGGVFCKQLRILTNFSSLRTYSNSCTTFNEAIKLGYFKILKVFRSNLLPLFQHLRQQHEQVLILQSFGSSLALLLRKEEFDVDPKKIF